ncbi:TPA: hypothetical protein ACPZNJ_000401 [Yersinia enterocolitica]|nr:hypothetical protein [Yersinia enterocolitica]ELZ9065114.1 hypothetical protein [Yersinia enterocolitica]HDL7972601.1 hypothetical protein [Yersinia enterocolitica]
MKMTTEETLGCLTSLLDLMTHCNDNTDAETIQNASFLGLALLANLKEKDTKKP